MRGNCGLPLGLGWGGYGLNLCGCEVSVGWACNVWAVEQARGTGTGYPHLGVGQGLAGDMNPCRLLLILCSCRVTGQLVETCT